MNEINLLKLKHTNIVFHRLAPGEFPRFSPVDNPKKAMVPSEFNITGYTEEEILNQLDDNIQSFLTLGGMRPIHLFYRPESLAPRKTLPTSISSTKMWYCICVAIVSNFSVTKENYMGFADAEPIPPAVTLDKDHWSKILKFPMESAIRAQYILDNIGNDAGKQRMFEHIWAPVSKRIRRLMRDAIAKNKSQSIELGKLFSKTIDNLLLELHKQDVIPRDLIHNSIYATMCDERNNTPTTMEKGLNLTIMVTLKGFTYRLFISSALEDKEKVEKERGIPKEVFIYQPGVAQVSAGRIGVGQLEQKINQDILDATSYQQGRI